jgi:hypothetical protein
MLGRVRQSTVLVLDDLLEHRELTRIVNKAESLEFEPQDLGGMALVPRLRAEISNPAISRVLWTALQPRLPPLDVMLTAGRTRSSEEAHWTLDGCNTTTRFYRYRRGAQFAAHVDEAWWPSPTRRSLLTVLLYLPSGGCVGGETVIDGEVVQAIDGRAVVFDHSLPHEGKPVERGEKLVLRSDVVATRTASEI